MVMRWAIDYYLSPSEFYAFSPLKDSSDQQRENIEYQNIKYFHSVYN